MKAIKYSILGLVLGTASLGTSVAQNVEQIYMKSGSVVEGYIAEQKPGKHITIQTTKATIVVNSDSLQNRVIERIPLEKAVEMVLSGEIKDSKTQAALLKTYYLLQNK